MLIQRKNICGQSIIYFFYYQGQKTTTRHTHSKLKKIDRKTVFQNVNEEGKMPEEILKHTGMDMLWHLFKI